MACPLDKLAVETRTMIYEYVLSFDTPLKHATKMQPFVKKPTGVEPRSGSGSTGSETETITDLQRVNTSILTANKLIYIEAIAVFYEHNTILFDAELCARIDVVSARATDLSLAKHVVVKMDDALDPDVDIRVGIASTAFEASTPTVPAIFPNLRTCSVYISADTDPRPGLQLTSMYFSLRRSPLFSAVYFDRVGSVSAVLARQPNFKWIVQSTWTIDRWAKDTEPITAGRFDYRTDSASSLYRRSRTGNEILSRLNALKAQLIFNRLRKFLKLPAPKDIDPNCHELWTSVDAYLCVVQEWGPCDDAGTSAQWRRMLERI